jgi:hypothetical protein
MALMPAFICMVQVAMRTFTLTQMCQRPLAKPAGRQRQLAACFAKLP